MYYNYNIRANSYSKVGAVEQRDMVNSGVRGKKEQGPQERGGLYEYRI
jgi:hypothetical protein